MDNIKHSLCIPGFNYAENKIDSKLWRIADYSPETREFYEAVYTEKGANEFLPIKIYAKKKDIETYNAEIFSWSVNENNIVESSKYKEKPIEIIKLENSLLKQHNSDITIREILYKGIKVHPYLSDEFLLVVNEDNDTYDVLLCNKKMFANYNSDLLFVQRMCEDISKIIHTVNLYTINKLDLIDTERVRIKYSQDEDADIRFFYRKLDLPTVIRKLYLREPSNYSRAFVSKYTKINKGILKVSNSDIKKLLFIIETALNDRKEIESFFKETEFQLLDVEYAMKQLSDEIIEIFMKDNEFLQIVENNINSSPKIRDEYLKQAKNIWIEEQNELKFIIEENIELCKSELDKYENELTQTTRKLEEENTEIISLLNEKNELIAECDKAKKDIEKLKIDAQLEISNFQENILKLASITAFTDINQNRDSNSYIHIKGEDLVGDTSIYADNLEDFISDLSDNLSTYGINKNYSYGLASFIVSNIIAKKQIIVCGGKSEIIANSLSGLICKKTADQMILSVGSVDILAIVNKIKEMEAKVVLLYCFLETYNESIFLSIVKLCPDKIIIFSCEDEQTYSNLPIHWCQYVSYISPIKVFSCPNKGELLLGEFDVKIFETVTDCVDVKSNIRKFLKPILSRDLLNMYQLQSTYEISEKYSKIGDDIVHIKFNLIENIMLSNSEIDIKDFIDEFELEEDLKKTLLIGAKNE